MYLKAIETKYKGYRFRSRSEARWAVFFDTAKIRWEYELEGFDVNGTWYLPDFYLPDFDSFFEVKGTDDYNHHTIKCLSDLTNKKVFVAIGKPPAPGGWSCGASYGLQTIFPFSNGHDDVAWGHNDMFLECNGCGRISIMNEVYSTMKDVCGSCHKSRLMPLDHALEAWRSARFEFGES